jgi:4-hydroxy-2-oxoheptanedioate aldolase
LIFFAWDDGKHPFEETPMKTFLLAFAILVLAIQPLTSQAPQAPQATAGKRINKAIDMLSRGQPIYYTGEGGGNSTESAFERGKKLAQTTADYINYNLEHGSFEMAELRQFMQGLVAGGPTKSGHRTPAVIVTLPMYALDAAQMRANNWIIHQILNTGVHGLLLTHADNGEAIRTFVQSARYPHAPPAPGLPLDAGLERGAGSEGFAAQIWGMSGPEYIRKADPWPLNPEGEIMLGLKIEERWALTNAEESARIAGISFAEWGPTDMGLSLLGPAPIPTGARGARGGGGENDSRIQHPSMVAARSRVLAATKAAKIAFLNACNESNVVDMIKEGVMICTGGDGPAAAKGREFTKRPQPW